MVSRASGNFLCNPSTVLPPEAVELPSGSGCSYGSARVWTNLYLRRSFLWDIVWYSECLEKWEKRATSISICYKMLAVVRSYGLSYGWHDTHEGTPKHEDHSFWVTHAWTHWRSPWFSHSQKTAEWVSWSTEYSISVDIWYWHRPEAEVCSASPR